MSAVDRMAVRTRSGEYRSMPRRQALALIAAGRAEAAKGSRVAEPTPAPPAHDLDAKLDAYREQLADGLGVPVEAITPTPGSNPHDVAAAQAQQMMDALPPELQYVSETDDPDVPTVDAVPLPPEPKPTARRGEWADYAGSLGVEVTSSMTKRQIQTAAEEAAQSLSNLPQPALTGGRLETPEDEPAAETVADDQDPRTR
jgi:hypothetical protein